MLFLQDGGVFWRVFLHLVHDASAFKFLNFSKILVDFFFF